MSFLDLRSFKLDSIWLFLTQLLYVFLLCEKKSRSEIKILSQDTVDFSYNSSYWNVEKFSEADFLILESLYSLPNWPDPRLEITQKRKNRLSVTLINPLN